MGFFFFGFVLSGYCSFCLGFRMDVGLSLPTDSALIWEASVSLLLGFLPRRTFPKNDWFLQIWLSARFQPKLARGTFLCRMLMVSNAAFFSLYFQIGEGLSLAAVPSWDSAVGFVRELVPFFFFSV